MITITLGTIPIAFDRIIKWIEILLDEGTISEPLFIQYGVSDITSIVSHPLVTAIPMLEKADLFKQISISRFVISHAGQGSTRWLAQCKKSFVLVPRLANYREHIDDHQLIFAKNVKPLGINYCISLSDLRLMINNIPPPIQGDLLQGPELVDHILQVYPPRR